VRGVASIPPATAQHLRFVKRVGGQAGKERRGGEGGASAEAQKSLNAQAEDDLRVEERGNTSGVGEMSEDRTRRAGLRGGASRVAETGWWGN
jgi:hypothetical protein